MCCSQKKYANTALNKLLIQCGANAAYSRNFDIDRKESSPRGWSTLAWIVVVSGIMPEAEAADSVQVPFGGCSFTRLSLGSKSKKTTSLNGPAELVSNLKKRTVHGVALFAVNTLWDALHLLYIYSRIRAVPVSSS